MLSTIWPAPRAATVGKISTLVITKPQVTQNTLKKKKVLKILVWGMNDQDRIDFNKFERTYRRIRGRHDIQMRAPTDGIIQSVQIIFQNEGR